MKRDAFFIIYLKTFCRAAKYSFEILPFKESMQLFVNSLDLDQETHMVCNKQTLSFRLKSVNAERLPERQT